MVPCVERRAPEFCLIPGYESRILIVLPAYPVCNHKIRAHGNDEQGKVLVMGVLREDVKGLTGQRFIYAPR